MYLDAVICWVDGNEPAHKRKLSNFKLKADKENIRDDSLSDKRFHDINEIYYCIKLIRKNAKFIRKIFLVTDNQCPYWLTHDLQRHLNIHVISHIDIFKKDSDLLPVFNSTSIECYLQNIDGLSKNFIYLNDDFFIIKKIEKDDFILNNKPVYRGSYFVRGLNRLWLTLNRPSLLPFGGLNTYRGFRHHMILGLIPFCRAHAPYVCNVDELHNTFNTTERREVAKNKFRTNSQFNPIDIQYNKLLRRNNAHVKLYDWFYMAASSFKKYSAIKDIESLKNNSKIKFLCIQDLSEASDADKAIIFEFLNELIES